MMKRRLFPLFGLLILLATAPRSLGGTGSGTWEMSWNTEGGMRYTDWEISQEAEVVVVKTDGQMLEGTLREGRLSLAGRFYSSEAGYSSTLKIEATVSEGEMKGSGTWDQYAMTFTGKRVDQASRD